MKNYIQDVFSLKGHVAVVTGASKGIGAEIAKALHNSGAIVYGIARSLYPKKKTNQIEYISCDITELAKLNQVFSSIYNKHSRIDILVNAAGITVPDEKHSLKQRAENFKTTIKTNTEGPFNTINIVSQYMKKNNSGSIINITSIGAEFGFPNNPAYIASKGALKMMTKGFAEDLAEYRIRVNNIAPGYIETDMTSKSFQNKKRYQDIISNTMLKRWGTSKDLIGAAIFLSSEASSYITGIDLVVDGGWSAKGLVQS